MPSLSAIDVLEIAAVCLPKVETDFIVRLFRYIGRVTLDQGLLAEGWVGVVKRTAKNEVKVKGVSSLNPSSKKLPPLPFFLFLHLSPATDGPVFQTEAGIECYIYYGEDALGRIPHIIVRDRLLRVHACLNNASIGRPQNWSRSSDGRSCPSTGQHLGSPLDTYDRRGAFARATRSISTCC